MKYFISLLTILMSFNVFSQELNILTEEDPPYSFTKDGKPAGYAVELVEEIQKRLGTKHQIRIQPWARVYNTALSVPNTVAFTMSRTKEREDLFNWVGPVVENDWVIITAAKDKIKFSSLEEAKKLRAIGVVRDYAWTNFLLSQGFKNLEVVGERKQNPMKLNADRIAAFVSADSSYASEIKEVGLKPEDFTISYTINTVQMYIAFSQHSDPKVIEQWQIEFNKIKRDGTLEKLLKKWLPSNKMPGSAKAGSI